MFEYTHENHFQFGYRINDNDYWMFPHCAEPEYEFIVKYGKYSPVLPQHVYSTNFAAECYRAARLIHESSDEISNIMFSGGNESEIVVRCFHDQKIPFRVSILKFKNDLNLHDVAFAVVFCEQRGIPYDIIELNIRGFLETEVYDYAERTKCASPMLPAIMWLADQIDGLPILGSGEPYLSKVVPDDYIAGVSPYERSAWMFQEKERIQSWYRHFMVQQRDAVPGFFQYTPELMYEFLDSPVVHELVEDKRHGKLSTVSTKGETYRLRFRDMIPRPKFHGYEKITELESFARDALVEEYGQYDRVVSIDYFEFMRRLRYGRA